MRTAVAETSLDAFRSFAPSELQEKEKAVMAVFWDLPHLKLTREQIAQRLHWKESQVCGRVNSLIAKRMLTENGEQRTTSGRTAKLVCLPESQSSLF